MVEELHGDVCERWECITPGNGIRSPQNPRLVLIGDAFRCPKCNTFYKALERLEPEQFNSLHGAKK